MRFPVTTGELYQPLANNDGTFSFCKCYHLIGSSSCFYSAECVLYHSGYNTLLRSRTDHSKAGFGAKVYFRAYRLFEVEWRYILHVSYGVRRV